MKIAVVGGGIAGLACAWMLSRRYAVTLFERHAQPGFVASSVAVPLRESSPDSTQTVRVDVPLRVFYPGYYPTLMRLYAALGVATEPVSYATTFMGAAGQPYFRWRNLRLGAFSMPYVLPRDVAGARARRIVQGALRFNRQSRAALVRGELAGRSLRDFLAAGAYPAEYVQGLLLPALATIATCTTEDALDYPAAVVAGYMAAGLARQSVRRAVLGADAVAARLLAGISQVVCSAGVQGLHHACAHDGRPVVRLLRDGGAQDFDHVVLATQANQALALWQDAGAADLAALQGFAYRRLEVVMHCDASFMPAQLCDWSPVNARVADTLDRPETTIWVNAVQPALRGAPPVFQTVHPQRQPREALVIGRAQFERPLVNAQSQQALAALQALQAQPGRRVWLCGSYAHSGVPLLESAVRSATEVARAIEARESGVQPGLVAVTSA